MVRSWRESVVLSGGFLLSHYYVPGGSQYWFERIADSPEKRGEWISLLDGRAVDLLTFRSQVDAERNEPAP